MLFYEAIDLFILQKKRFQVKSNKKFHIKNNKGPLNVKKMHITGIFPYLSNRLVIGIKMAIVFTLFLNLNKLLRGQHQKFYTRMCIIGNRQFSQKNFDFFFLKQSTSQMKNQIGTIKHAIEFSQQIAICFLQFKIFTLGFWPSFSVSSKKKVCSLFKLRC